MIVYVVLSAVQLFPALALYFFSRREKPVAMLPTSIARQAS